MSSGGFGDQSSGGGFADDSKVQVRVIDNSGSGGGRYVDVPKGTTLVELFRQQFGQAADPREYFFRVNRDSGDPVSTYVLQQGDTISITAKKVKGAVYRLLAAVGGFFPRAGLAAR
jgi:hypothetical protein